MASPGDFKGQRRGACGHIMAVFDLHKHCARCREKKLGEDLCVKDKPCSLCDKFSETQKETLSTPSYRIRKERKAGLLVSPKDVTVISPVEDLSSANAPTDNCSAHPSAQPVPDSQPSAQLSTQAPAASSASTSDTSYVTSDQLFALSDKISEQFARFQALLSRGNIFTAPSMPVNPVPAHKVLSDTPFLDPSSARPTGPVWLPAEAEDNKGSDAKPEKTRSSQATTEDMTDTGSQALPAKAPVSQPAVQSTGPPTKELSATGPTPSYSLASATYRTTGPEDYPQASVYSDLPYDPEDSEHYSASEPDEGELSDTGEKQEVTEDMNYRETVQSVRSFMGWNHIPVFEADFSEPDKSNNPWKGKVPRRPARVSVAMPPDDWLCQKLERLNTTVAEGYPSRSQDSSGLKKDQFIKMPKSQARWYQMHTLKPDTTPRPGKSVFSWRNTEAKVNSQFPRITKASSYPPSGPVSRPISQEYLRRWERNTKEGSYIVNQAAGFNRCASELQDRMNHSLVCFQSNFNKGKAPKEVSEALHDLKDYLAFHQNVSIAMGTSLQHLADCLFVNMANLVLLRRDSYLDHVKPGVKPDTWTRLRNAPLFNYGLFPDDLICIAEQDITKSESTSAAPRPGPGAMQRTGWRNQNRFQPYDRRDSRNAAPAEPAQPWRQFARGRGRSRGRGRGSNPRFSRARGFKHQK